MRTTKLVPTLAGLAALLASAQTQAVPLLYGVQGTVFGNPNTYPRLVTIETSAPYTLTEIGPLGVPFVRGGLAYDPNSNTLYGIDNVTPAGNLYTIGLNTGAATLVGPHGIDPLVGAADLRGLAFDTTNDVLYGGAGSGVPGDLWELNLVTGGATHIGELPYPTPSPQLGGLAYDSLRDILVGLDLGTGDLWSIDRTTPANSTFLADLTPDTTSRIDGLTYDSVNDLLWATDPLARLYSYDPSNGYARILHADFTTTGEIAALTFVVPEPSTALLLACGLVGLAMQRRRLH
jgi:hypothetical protein